MTTAKKETRSPLLILILIAIGLWLAYVIVLFLAKCFVYFGYNFFVFTDNLFQISSFNPVVVWGVMGLFIGSIAGVAIAIKKYQLSRKLIAYPVGAIIFLLLLFYFINQPANHNGAVNMPGAADNTSATSNIAAAPVYYYITTQSVNARSGFSLNYPVNFVIEKGEEVELIDRNFMDSRNVEWMKIKYNNEEGYVSSKFLRYSRSQ